MPRPCHALTMPFFSRPRHSTAVERRPVGYLPAFGFFRLLHGVPRRLLSEAYQSSSQRSIPATVKSGSSTLQKGQSVKLSDWQFGDFRLTRRLSRRTRHCWNRAGERHGMCELTHDMVGERHGHGMLCVNPPLEFRLENFETG
jgi:nucleoid DNA-binding protein